MYFRDLFYMVRVHSITLQNQYRDLQYITRAMILEVDEGLEDRLDFDDLVTRMVEKIMTDMYEKYTDREISNAITIVKIAMEEGD